MEINKDELVSIVVPIYNVQDYLKRSIESILAQTYENIEIILVDDGSTDNSGKLCDEYLKKDNRIQVIHKENGGLSDARNVGLESSSGKYIAFIDPDDYIDKDFITTLYNMCVENNANISQCSYEIVTDNQKENANIEIKEEILKLSEKEAICNIFNKNNVEYTVACNKLYKTSLFDNIKYPKGKLHEDEATTYKLFYEAKNIVVTNLKLYYYYIRENSITNKKYTLKRLDFIDELEEQLQFFKDRNEKEIYIQAYYRYSRSLIQSYYRCKKNIENSEDVQKKLLNKYKESVKYLLNKKEINIKRKCILLFGYAFPNLYGRIFVK